MKLAHYHRYPFYDYSRGVGAVELLGTGPHGGGPFQDCETAAAARGEVGAARSGWAVLGEC